MVDWRASQDPAARHREVRSSHHGLISAADVFAVIAAEINEILDRPALRSPDADGESVALGGSARAA